MIRFKESTRGGDKGIIVHSEMTDEFIPHSSINSAVRTGVQVVIVHNPTLTGSVRVRTLTFKKLEGAKNTMGMLVGEVK